MDREIVDEFIKKKSKEIALILMNTYDSADFEGDLRTILNEIADISLSYSKIFFFESESFLDDNNRANLRSYLRMRFTAQAIKTIDKMRDIELLANCIELAVMIELEDNDISLF